MAAAKSPDINITKNQTITKFTSLPEEPNSHCAMNTRFLFVAFVFSAMLVVATCNHADENIVSVSKLNLDPECTDICRKETPSCTWKEDYADSGEEDKISEECMKDANPCYLRCTTGEPDHDHGINNIKVSEQSADENCANKCRSGIPECTTTGDVISEDCTHHPQMIDCYSVCMGAVEPED
ncbi:hypothetical protein CAPTEDRAFT_190978 [Capitella teleta]|uniref:Uncharacterized protein n=1 Tax=Capitella teleta TaxID=283909 RepID=R7TJ35_CAPTE|nr:hypothetical protein CAPTEDRAFT_190978 [Capitella teleta]|eukprot:ELT93798.1 hypothetical protein CAPTEDRAFT_190978 [Capitella teleta]